MNRLVRELPLYTFVLAALVAVLAYGTVRHLTARAAHPPKATVEAARALAEEQGQVTLHIADPSADIGPGDAEPMLAIHPAP
jgi:hypothetical protein